MGTKATVVYKRLTSMHAMKVCVCVYGCGCGCGCVWVSVYVCSCECVCVPVCVFFLVCKQINPKMMSQMRGEERVHTL